MDVGAVVFDPSVDWAAGRVVGGGEHGVALAVFEPATEFDCSDPEEDGEEGYEDCEHGWGSGTGGGEYAIPRPLLQTSVPGEG